LALLNVLFAFVELLAPWMKRKSACLIEVDMIRRRSRDSAVCDPTVMTSDDASAA